MSAADFGKILEADRERQFARLQLLATQLADQPRRLAQRKRQRRLVIRLVVRQRRVAGNRRAVFYCPAATARSTDHWRKARAACPQMPNFCLSNVDGNFATWPNVSAPSAASERCRFLPMPESSRTKRSFKNSFSPPGLTSMKPGLAASVASLASREELARPGGHGDFHLARNALADFAHIFFRRRISENVTVHRREIQEAFINGNRHQRRRVFLQHMKHLRRNPAILVVMRPAQHAARTQPLRLETCHAGFDAEFFRRVIGRDDDAVAAPAAADPDRTMLQISSLVFCQCDFAARKKTVAIHVQNPVVRLCVQSKLS